MKAWVNILFLFALRLGAQSYSLEIRISDDPALGGKIKHTTRFASVAERDKEVQQFLFTLWDNAYLAARIDSSAGDSLKQLVYISAGQPYEWASLRKGNADEGLLSAVGFREKIYNGKTLYYKDLRKLFEKILSHYENNGYPFASVRLDSIQVKGNEISAALNVRKNQLVRIDSIIIRGKPAVSRVYLYTYFGLKPGDPYNESLIRKIPARVKELPFLNESRPPEVYFTQNHTSLYLYLEKKKASQFDGFIGILPDQAGKIHFTGDIRLKLLNAFSYGELVDINWRSLQAQTQDLRSRVNIPFVFRTPFGIDGGLKIYKKDSTWLEVSPNLGVQYLLTGGNYFKVFIARKELSLLSSSSLQYATVLPPYADVSTLHYGIAFKSEKLDYRLNPRQGYSFSLSGSTGKKTIKKNPGLDEDLYTGIDLVSNQYLAEGEGAFYLPLMKRSTLKAGLQGAFLVSKNIFTNELFRIGGLKTLRGFDEESIFASAYGILTLEYRYLLEENSHLFLFADGAYYENSSRASSSLIHDTPFGFGAGISFSTRAGIFSITYALGRQAGNPIYLKSGKVHFGIVNYF
ncbi:MAG: BamA/TamA family outer membrane protein [Bacteroidota bacterium]